MPFVQLPDVRLFFTDEGPTDPVPGAEAGAPLLFVHGYTADSHDWSWQLAHFVTDHRVIAVDFRGHGRSSAPLDGYTSAQLADDLLGLLDHLEVAQVVAFGHSMGASIVSTLAVEHPDRVVGVVAVDPAYLLDDGTTAALVPVLDAIDDDGLVPFVQSIVGDGMDAPARDAALRTWQVRRIAGLEPHVLRQTLIGQVSGMVLRSESEPYLRRRRCPVLSFYADPLRAPVEAAILAGDDRSRVVSWEGAGHWLHQERPAELNALVDLWLEAVA